MAQEVFIAAGARTAIGAFNGAFAEIAAPQLGAAAIRASLERAGISADAVNGVIMGNVLAAGLGQNPARQAAISAGLPTATPTMTVNKVCGSGLASVILASQAIRAGDASVIVAGGMENMTRAPYLLEKARSGYRFGDGVLVDSMTRDGLSDAYESVAMGVFADRTAMECDLTRERLDDYAVASYQRALDAINSGAFAREIVPVEARRGKALVTVTEDESASMFDEAKLRRLKPAFGNDGVCTAGNSSSINDGAAALVVMSADSCRELAVAPVARILGATATSREPERFTLAPLDAIESLLRKLHLSVSDVDLFEINEAFAVVPLAAMDHLNVPHDKLNVNGGAIALGHPLGASGARVLVTLLHALQAKNLRVGVAALCIGGGESVAMAVERL